MRKVLLNKYKYTYKDFFRWLGIIFIHFFGFYSYVLIVLGFHEIQGGPFFPTINGLNWEILYPMTIAPIFSGLMYIIYAERGSTNLKAILWIHALGVVLFIPIVIFGM